MTDRTEHSRPRMLLGVAAAVVLLAVAAPALADEGGTGAPSPAAGSNPNATAGATDDGVTALNGEHVHGVKAQDIAAEAEPNEPLDAATRDKLQMQLVSARETALRYPTVTEAEAAGFHLAGGFAPGSGAHYVSYGNLSGPGDVDPTRPEALIYDGVSPTSEIVGLMYYGMAEEAPEGFAGPNDHWHRHSAVCTKFGPDGIEIPYPADADVTKAMCDRVDGLYMETTGYMVHAWVVPSWESPLGVFSHDNPDVRCADGTYDTDAAGFCQGT
jgi:hypothetical protein